MLSDITLTFLTRYLYQHIYSYVLLDTGKQYSLTFQLDQIEGSMISSLLLWAHCFCLFLHLFLSQLSLRKWPCPKFIFLLLPLFLPLPQSFTLLILCLCWHLLLLSMLRCSPPSLLSPGSQSWWGVKSVAFGATLTWASLLSSQIHFSLTPKLSCFPAASRKTSHSSWIIASNLMSLWLCRHSSMSVYIYLHETRHLSCPVVSSSYAWTVTGSARVSACIFSWIGQWLELTLFLYVALFCC